MRLFANPRCRTLLICGTLLIFGAMPSELQAQDAQAQSSFRSDMALFDEFLEAHADLDAQLRSNPSLLTNDEFLENHAQLQNFLVQHPNLRAQINQNPSEFFKRREDFHTARRNRGAANPNPDLTRQQVADMDRFLDNNPQIDRDLHRNPSLVTNADYLQDHPALQAFLNQHPEMKEEIAENPRYFMRREGRFDAQEPARARANASANVNANPDLSHQQVADMDRFLDNNPQIDRDVRGNPSLLTNADYLQDHPGLQAFLNQHPEMKEEIAENPRYFMQREGRFDAQEPARARANASANVNANPDLTRQQVADMDRFLDGNPQIDRDLRRNPSLLANADYLEDHPALQTFLNQHPEMKEEITENPRYFMQREGRFDAQEPARARANANAGANVNANPDLTRQEVATMGDFLDRHPDIGKSLQKKPNLINDKGFLKRHKDLDEFLNEHPAVREEVRENPSFFMNREQQFEARNIDRDRAIADRDRDVRDRSSNTRDVDSDLDRKELKNMDHFLDKHKGIEKDLRKKPELVNDRDYLKHHKSLEAFLDKNPRVGDELRENPARFMRDQERFERRSHRMDNRADVKTKTDEKKIDEKEKMSTPIPH